MEAESPRGIRDGILLSGTGSDRGDVAWLRIAVRLLYAGLVRFGCNRRVRDLSP